MQLIRIYLKKNAEEMNEKTPADGRKNTITHSQIETNLRNYFANAN